MRRGITPVTAVVLVAVLTGCGILPDRQGGGGEERQAASQSQAVSPPQAVPQPQTEEPAAMVKVTAAAEELGAIASRKVSHGGSNLRVDITGLRRQGKIATLTWTVANLDERTDTWYLGSRLSSAGLDITVSGVSLIDPVNGRRYRVARNGTDEDAKCVCSNGSETIKGGSSLELYAVYGAPPADVTKVNVEFPNLGVFTDVPIS
ncbi:hypothetical protein SAMN05216276_10637 [Streptosporangium subroseum]|uniref:DUF4352 domain-containing protein n=1 Tax=Streptosporangium subroseum TaxID=106412 RepID=A0A239NMC6_9ACTN|nr:hypothetical protein SAMN05216276_10637 [Streptosporangium subroseum]